MHETEGKVTSKVYTELAPESVVESAVRFRLRLRDRWQRINKRRTTLAGKAASFSAEDVASYHIRQREAKARQQSSAT
eukprot:1801385-Amphidinium_carterae.1